MTALRHKGYQGAVTYEDGSLLIQVLHIDDFVAAECERASEVQRTFEELVDGYIDACKRIGKDPARPFRGSFNVRVSPALHRRAAMAAIEQGLTLNGWVARAVEECLERKGSQKPVFDAAAVALIASRIAPQMAPATQAPDTISARPARNLARNDLLRIEQHRDRDASRWQVNAKNE